MWHSGHARHTARPRSLTISVVAVAGERGAPWRCARARVPLVAKVGALRDLLRRHVQKEDAVWDAAVCSRFFSFFNLARSRARA